MQLEPGLQMERGLWKAAGPSDSRLHTPSFHTGTIDLDGHRDRGYLNQLDNTLRRGQAKIWLCVPSKVGRGGNLDHSVGSLTDWSSVT